MASKSTMRVKRKTSLFVGIAVVAILAIMFFSLSNTFTAFAYLQETETGVSAPAASITRVENSGDITSLDNDGYHIAIMEFDESLNLVVSDSVSYTVEQALTDLGDVMPAFVLETENQTTALLSLLRSKVMADVYLISSDQELLTSAKNTYSSGRVVFDATSYTGDKTAFDFTAPTQSAGGTIVMISEEYAQEDFVREIRSRFTSVWIESTATDSYGALSLLLTGAHGIIETGSNHTKTALESLTTDNTLLRTPLIVGHRGANYTDGPDLATTDLRLPENSIAAVEFAYENSADMIEIDVRLTADNEVVVIHDGTLDRTLDVGDEVDVNVTDKTLEEIKAYPYKGCLSEYSDQVVPSLAELLEVVDDMDVVLIIEIKSYEEELPPLIAEIVTEAGVEDQVVFIAFGSGQMELIKNALPQCGSGYLLNYDESYADDSVASVTTNLAQVKTYTESGRYSYSPNSGNFTQEFINQLAIRGVSFNGWTYLSYGSITTNEYATTRWNAFVGGVSSLTTDGPQFVNYYAKSFACSETMELEMGGTPTPIAINTFNSTSYAVGESITENRVTKTIFETSGLSATVIEGDSVSVVDGQFVANSAGETKVVLNYTYTTDFGTYTITSGLLTITVSSSSGCSSEINMLSTSAIICLLLVAVSVALIVAVPKIKRARNAK